MLNSLEPKYATRITDSSTSTLDLVITDCITSAYKFDTDNLHFSDHKQIFLNIDFNIQSISSPETIQLCNLDYRKFSRLLPSKIQIQPDSFSAFTQTLNSLQDECKQIKIIKKNTNSYKKPWFCRELKSLVKQRKLYYDLSKKFPRNIFYATKYKQLQLDVTISAEFYKKKILRQ